MTVVIITGGAGFLGQSLASCILKDCSSAGSDDNTVSHIVLADVAFPPVEEMQPSVAQAMADGTVTCRAGSVASREYCDSLLRMSASMSSGSVSIFHLSAIMSGQGEMDFDLCMDVNLRGTMHMLEAARAHSQSQSQSRPQSGRVKFVYASAGATIGSGAPQDWIQKEDVITDATRATPHTSYGMTKAVGELLLADYSRRSFVDGRGARLPTVVVRAGAPNAATTSCFSGVVREPLAGVEAVMPIAPTSSMPSPASRMSSTPSESCTMSRRKRWTPYWDSTGLCSCPPRHCPCPSWRRPRGRWSIHRVIMHWARSSTRPMPSFPTSLGDSRPRSMPPERCRSGAFPPRLQKSW